MSSETSKACVVLTGGSLGKAEHRFGTVTTQRVDYPYGRAPFATFKFKYRSHKDLQAECIIPRSPSPVPLEERDADSLSLEEAREYFRRDRERKANDIKIKQEVKMEKRSYSQVIDDDDEDSGNDELEVAAIPASRKRPRTFRDSGVEFVDLSDD